MRVAVLSSGCPRGRNRIPCVSGTQGGVPIGRGATASDGWSTEDLVCSADRCHLDETEAGGVAADRNRDRFPPVGSVDGQPLHLVRRGIVHRGDRVRHCDRPHLATGTRDGQRGAVRSEEREPMVAEVRRAEDPRVAELRTVSVRPEDVDGAPIDSVSSPVVQHVAPALHTCRHGAAAKRSRDAHLCITDQYL